MNWYYLEDSSPKGPISDRDLEVLIQTNILSPSALVYHDGLPDWTPFNELHLEKPVEQQQEESAQSEEEQEFDEEKLEMLKKKIEKKKKKAEKEKQRKKKKWYEPKINTNVYVQGLPSDITVEEMHDYFQKAGVIRINPATLQPVIKIYKDENGQCKGDGLISYKMQESVGIAKDILNGGQIRGNILVVEEAHFEQKGEYKAREQKKIDKMNVVLARQKEMAQLAWDGDTEADGLKILIMRNMFQPTEDEQFIQDLYSEVLAEIEASIGEIHKMEIFREMGVIKVKFLSASDAEKCVKLMDGRFFDGNQIEVQYWDGKEQFKTLQENDQQRLEEFGQWLESDDA